MKFVTSPKSGIVSVVYTTEHGRRQSSTGTKNKAEAKIIAKEAKVLELEAAAKTIRLSHAVVAQIIAGKKIKLSDAVTEWREWMDIHVAPKTAYGQALAVEQWIAATKLGSALLNAVKDKHVHEWVNASDDTKIGTRKFRLSAVRSLFKFATIRTYVIHDPSVGVRVSYDGLRHEQKETESKKPFTASEFDRLLKYLDSEIIGCARSKRPPIKERKSRFRFWKLAVLISRHTGLRLGDICRLEWAALARCGHIRVWTDKSNKPVEPPIPAEARKIFDAIPHTHKVFCFPDEQRQYANIKTRASLSKEFSRICTYASVDGRTFHSLRATYVTECRRKGVPILTIAKRVGHSSTSTTQTYDHS